MADTQKVVPLFSNTDMVICCARLTLMPFSNCNSAYALARVLARVTNLSVNEEVRTEEMESNNEVVLKVEGAEEYNPINPGVTKEVVILLEVSEDSDRQYFMMLLNATLVVAELSNANARWV